MRCFVQLGAAERHGRQAARKASPDDGVVAGTPQLTTTDAQGASCSWIVAATAFREGTLYVDVLVQGTAGDQHPSRSVVIPIRIGATATAAPMPCQTDRARYAATGLQHLGRGECRL
jgi:hypothetical protein